jgi:hypothetical protein
MERQSNGALRPSQLSTRDDLVACCPFACPKHTQPPTSTYDPVPFTRPLKDEFFPWASSNIILRHRHITLSRRHIVRHIIPRARARPQSWQTWKRRCCRPNLVCPLPMDSYMTMYAPCPSRCHITADPMCLDSLPSSEHAILLGDGSTKRPSAGFADPSSPTSLLLAS